MKMKKVLFAGLLAVAALSVSAQNVIKNEKFAAEVANKVTNANKAAAGEWFIMNNEAAGTTTIAWEQTGDVQYPNAMKIDNSGAAKNTSWYKAFVGQRLTDGLEKGVYVLTFYAKAKEAGAQVGAYIKQTNEEKGDNGKYETTFFMRRDYDADAQPNASGAQYNFKIKEAGKWTKVVVYYDMSKVVNAINSKKSNPDLEVDDVDADDAILKDCYLAILSQSKGGVVEISDVVLRKVK